MRKYQKYTVSLNPEYVDPFKARLKEMGYSFSGFLNTLIEGQAKLLQEEGLLEKPMRQWSIEESGRFVQALLRDDDENCNREDFKGSTYGRQAKG